MDAADLAIVVAILSLELIAVMAAMMLAQVIGAVIRNITGRLSARERSVVEPSSGSNAGS